MRARWCRPFSSEKSSADAESRHQAGELARLVVTLLVRAAEQRDLLLGNRGTNGEAVVRLIGEERAAALPCAVDEAVGEEGGGRRELGGGGQSGVVGDDVVRAVAGGIRFLCAADLVLFAHHGSFLMSVSHTRSSWTCSLASTRLL